MPGPESPRARRIGAGVALAALAAAGTAVAWPWSVDMVYQPVLKPGRSPAWRPPLSAVPWGDPDPPVDREQAQGLEAPSPADETSIARGGELFQIYCSPCHGADGAGAGPVAKVYVPPPSLLVGPNVGRPDGWIYGTIRDGGAIMPSYGMAVEPGGRWDIVHWIRARQRDVPPPPPPGGAP